MTTMIILPLCFLLSLVLALYFVPVMRKAAMKWGVMDRPDGELKTQREAVPYLGGIGVYLAFLLSLSLVYDFSPQVMGLLLGGTIMLLIGLVDDFGVLLPYQKLAGQFLAVFVLIKAGIYIEIEAFPMWLSVIMSVIWMIGIINAVNIIDVADGLATGTSFIAAVGMMIVALVNGNDTIAVLTAALAGSLLGFLYFNSNPARIYLGDTGSLFIGLMLGALAMIGDYSDSNPAAYIAPIMMLGVPIFDTVFVILMRAKKGLPVFLGSPDHFALRLQRRGLSVRQVVALSYFISVLLTGLAIANMWMSPESSIILFAAVVIGGIAMIFYLNRMED